MEFKDKLIKYINERGGLTPENLRHISAMVRKEVPDFTLPYFRRLLAGHPPRETDRDALETALGLPPFTLADDGETIGGRSTGDICRIAARYLKRRGETIEFLRHLRSAYSFRSGRLTERELRNLIASFETQRRFEVEIDVFGLDTDDG